MPYVDVADNTALAVLKEMPMVQPAKSWLCHHQNNDQESDHHVGVCQELESSISILVYTGSTVPAKAYPVASGRNNIPGSKPSPCCSQREHLPTGMYYPFTKQRH